MPCLTRAGARATAHGGAERRCNHAAKRAERRHDVVKREDKPARRSVQLLPADLRDASDQQQIEQGDEGSAHAGGNQRVVGAEVGLGFQHGSGRALGHAGTIRPDFPGVCEPVHRLHGLFENASRVDGVSCMRCRSSRDQLEIEAEADLRGSARLILQDRSSAFPGRPRQAERPLERHRGGGQGVITPERWGSARMPNELRAPWLLAVMDPCFRKMTAGLVETSGSIAPGYRGVGHHRFPFVINLC